MDGPFLSHAEPTQHTSRKEEAVYMLHYVVLMNWTDQGIRNVRETIQRVEAADASSRSTG